MSTVQQVNRQSELGDMQRWMENSHKGPSEALVSAWLMAQETVHTMGKHPQLAKLDVFHKLESTAQELKMKAQIALQAQNDDFPQGRNIDNEVWTLAEPYLIDPREEPHSVRKLNLIEVAYLVDIKPLLESYYLAVRTGEGIYMTVDVQSYRRSGLFDFTFVGRSIYASTRHPLQRGIHTKLDAPLHWLRNDSELVITFTRGYATTGSYSVVYLSPA